jgi:hypothetical protein
MKGILAKMRTIIVQWIMAICVIAVLFCLAMIVHKLFFDEVKCVF